MNLLRSLRRQKPWSGGCAPADEIELDSPSSIIRHADLIRAQTQWSKASLRRADIQVVCTFMVLCSAAASIAAITLGILIKRTRQDMPDFLKQTMIDINFLQVPITDETQYFIGRYALASTQMASVFALLVLNVVITAFLEAHGKVASSALLWFKYGENNERVQYNTNSHFLNGTKRFGPCHWTVNAFTALCMALSYGAAANLMSRIHILGTPDTSGNLIEGAYPGTRYAVDISAWPLIILGASLFAQSFVSFWIFAQIGLSTTKDIKTWSSNPVVNAIYMVVWTCSDRWTEARSNNVKSDRQSAARQVARVRILTRIVWGGFAVMLVFVIVAIYFAAKAHSFETGILNVWENFGLLYTPVAEDSSITDWASSLITAGVQGALALVLYCADTVVSFLNDEDSWQDAFSRYAEKRNAFVPPRFEFRWRSSLLFVAKSGVQWVIGLAVTVDWLFIVQFIPVAVVTTLLLIIAVWLEVIIRKKPGGRGPTTYGELDLLFRSIARYHLLWLDGAERPLV